MLGVVLAAPLLDEKCGVDHLAKPVFGLALPAEAAIETFGVLPFSLPVRM
jgi:hypothetical protein